MINRSSAPENVSDFILKSVILESDKSPTKIDLSQVVSDLDIFEHLNKPYLTGMLLFVDNQGIFSKLNISGGERIEITILSTRKEAIPIVKRFVVSKITNNIKVNDNAEAISLQLIEDFAFYSNALNVNRAYSNTPTNIVQKISADYLNKEVESVKDNFQEIIKVIVPNLNPIEALMWIKNTATNKSGFPYYLFSSLFEPTLKFYDLETLITAQVMNPSSPYSYWQSNSQSADTTRRRRTIESYSYSNIDDIFSLIDEGVIGAEYTYLNTLTGTNHKFDFDIVSDVFLNLHENVLNKEQNVPIYSPDLSYDNQIIHKLKSRTITQIGGAGVYTDGINEINSYNEASTIGEYKKKVIAKSLTSFLSKSPINISVNGLDFIDGEANSTIGNSIKIQFLTSEIDSKTQQNKIDNKKSGDYLIYSARHMFKNERYDILLGCTKLANSEIL